MKLSLVLIILQAYVAIILITEKNIQFHKKYYITTITIENDNATKDLIVNVFLEVPVSIARRVFTISLNIANGPKDVNYQIQIVKSTIDFCKMTKGLTGNFLFKMLAEAFKKESVCPMLPGTYNTTNWKINEKLIPSFLMRNISFMIKIEAKGTISGVGNSVKLFSAKILGKLIII